MWAQIALFAGQFILGEVTRQRPKKVSWEEFINNNEPSEVRPVPYAGGTIELTPARQWYGDFKQRAVERDSHWTDYLFMGASAFLLDTITVAYRYYIGEMFPLCFGPDRHVQRVTIEDRPAYQAPLDFDNAGSGFLIDDPQAWGGDQPPGEGGQYSWCVVTRGNYTDPTNTYLEQMLATPPNKCPSLRGVTALISQGPSGSVEESGYFAAGGVGFTPRLKEWKVVVRAQPDNLATGFNKIGRHMNPMEVIYEWSTSLEFGARAPLEELNLDNWRACAETLYNENNGWSGRIEGTTSPGEVIKDILAQIDAAPDFSPSLGLGFKLIRRDYSFGSLRILDKSVITSIDEFTPGTYEDTINKVYVEFPEDQNNNFKPRKAPYIDIANQLIQGGRDVPQTVGYLGVADMEQGQVIATRLGRAQSLPRAPLECEVFPSWGRLSHIGEVVIFQWSSPSLQIVMRVLKITPNGPAEQDYRLVLVEDQFATGLRTFGEPGESQHVDPAAGLSVAPPSATWNTTDFPPDGLRFDLTTANTNEFLAVITGGIVFGTYAPGGQYARLYVTEPGGAQTLSPVRLAPDADNEATFTWPALAAGTYEFCVQTFSLRDATNGVKVCAEIAVAAIGSPSASPSASVSPSSSVSRSPSASASVSPSPSLSPSASASPSHSVSPSASQSPSASVSPSGPPPPAIVFMDSAEHTLSSTNKWVMNNGSAPATGVSGAHGSVHDDSIWGAKPQSITASPTVSARFRVMFRVDAAHEFLHFANGGAAFHAQLRHNVGGTLSVKGAGGTAFVHTTTDTYALNTWYEVEMRVTVGNSGSYTLKVDGVIPNKSGGGLMDQSGVDVQDGGTTTIDRVLIGSETLDTYTDDEVIDNAGNDLGLGQVEILYPNGAGDLAEMSRGGADSGANWSQCDEAIYNSNTDYVFNTVADKRDCYTFQNRSVSGTPRAVQVVAAFARNTSGTFTCGLFLRIGGVNYDGTEVFTAGSNYTIMAKEVWNSNPATSAPWTDSDIDNLQAGIHAIDANIRMTQIVVEVYVET